MNPATSVSRSGKARPHNSRCGKPGHGQIAGEPGTDKCSPGKSHTTKSSKNTHKKTPRLSRSELNAQAWQRKQQKKHRGNPPGSRFNIGMGQRQTADNPALRNDPRIGSKKPVPLITDPQTLAAQEPATLQHDSRQKNRTTDKPLSAEQELAMLENQPRLDALLDQLDAGETIAEDDQHWLDTTLARIEQLMQQLGIMEQDNDLIPADDDLLRLLKGKD